MWGKLFHHRHCANDKVPKPSPKLNTGSERNFPYTLANEWLEHSNGGFGSDEFPLLISMIFRFQPWIFQGVNPFTKQNRATSWSELRSITSLAKKSHEIHPAFGHQMIFHNLFKKNTLGNFRNGFIFKTLSKHHIQSSQNNGGDPQTGLPKNPPPPNLAVQIPPNLTRNKNTEPLDVEPQGFPGNASDFVGRFSSPKTRGNYRSNFFPERV